MSEGNLTDGSSPLARGTHDAFVRMLEADRFIPARAGNTAARNPPNGLRPVHPRSRGEHPEGAPCARHAAVHPRSRGEHPRRVVLKPIRIGSSPLARGTRRAELPGRCPDRFIPARAGNTTSSSSAGRTFAVHPRSRGEHPTRVDSTASSSGSSPLARGTRGVHLHDLGAPRFIPARAGNTARLEAQPRALTVHPRSRGEHVLAPVRELLGVGSSPLARGTPRRPPTS